MLPWFEGMAPVDPEIADEHGLVAIGGRLEPRTLLAAYRAGIFPWSSDPVITWWCPDPRAVFDLANWQPPRSLRRSIARAGWRLTVDRDFGGVMRGCAEPSAGRESTWITDDFIVAYGALHRLGHAHSFEVWEGDELVGGLYGVSIGGFFGGESMFRRRTDASKAALAHTVVRLRAGGFVLFDAQVPNPHLTRIGAVEMPRAEYLARLAEALGVGARITG